MLKIVPTPEFVKQVKKLAKSYKQISKERNSKILEALADGYKQSEIARYLGLSSAGVSYILRCLEGIGSFIGNKGFGVI